MARFLTAQGIAVETLPQAKHGDCLRATVAGGELAIAIRDQIVAHGPPTVGSRLPVTIDDQPCELVIKNTFEDTSVRVRPSMDRTSPGAPKVQNRDLQTRTLRGLTVELVSAAGPVPGSDASLRGARSLPSLPWGLPALIHMIERSAKKVAKKKKGDGKPKKKLH